MQEAKSNAKVVQKYLKDNGIKQVFLAEKIGVSPKRLSDMLCGKLEMPDTVFWDAVRVLGIEVSPNICQENSPVKSART